jgi:RHS repeat-associated protein
MRDGVELVEPETYRYRYDVYSRICETEYADDTIMQRKFNRFGNLIGVIYWEGDETPNTLDDNSKMMEFRYQFDLSGNRISTEELYWNPTDNSLYQRRLLSFQYDAAGRLAAEEKEDNGTRVATYYRYDAASNRIGMLQDIGGDGKMDIITDYIFDLQDRLRSTITSIGTESLTTTYFYGANGTAFLNSGYETRETLTDRILERVEYQYDLMGFLESIDRVSYGTATERSLEEFSNDPRGERLTRRERAWTNGLLTRDDSWLEIHDNLNPTGHSQLLEVRRADSGEVERVLVAGKTLLGEAIQDKEIRSYMTDGLGSVRRWGSDWTDAIDQTFNSFGELEGSETTRDQPSHGYTGELSISDGKLLHLRKRTYDPNMGRFLQPDTFDGLVTDPATLNRYMYAANNPLKFRDPSGNVFIFFDGTWNHDDPARLAEGTSFTNIVRMRDAYLNSMNRQYIYRRGVGNIVDRWSPIDGILSGATGLGMLQIAESALTQFQQWHRYAKHAFVAGFSRGAATSLLFSHLLQKEEPQVQIREMYLYDTVTSTGIPGNGINFGVPAYAASNVQSLVHAIAYQEDRTNFVLSNMHGKSGRIAQKAFWGMHGDVGGGYAERQDLSKYTLWWISNRVIRRLPNFENRGTECLSCDRDSSHYPHPPLTYIMHGGKSLGELMRPTTEHPMLGTLALAYFFSDIDFSMVGAEAIGASVAALAYIPLYIAFTDFFANAAVFAATVFYPPAAYYTSGLAAAYRQTHYALLYMSMLQYYINRI